MLRKRIVVGVMGAGAHEHDELANPLGTALAHAGVDLLTGGGTGVMTSVARAFVAVEPRRGQSIGIIPTYKQDDGRYLMKEGYPNPYIELPVITPLPTYAGDDLSVISRNYINILTAQAVIALPGSGGTRNEIRIAALMGTPICLLGPHDLPLDFEPGLPRRATVEEAMAWLRQHIALE